MRVGRLGTRAGRRAAVDALDCNSPCAAIRFREGCLRVRPNAGMIGEQVNERINGHFGEGRRIKVRKENWYQQKERVRDGAL